MDGWVAGGRVGGWVNGWMYGRMDGWVGGWMDGSTYVAPHVSMYLSMQMCAYDYTVYACIYIYTHLCVCVSAFVFGGMQAGMHTYIDVLFTHACVLYATSDSYAENIQHSSHHGHKDD